MIRLIAYKLAPHLLNDPRPALVAAAVGMDQPGWPADPATHLGMAQNLLRNDPTAFAILMHRLDQLELGSSSPRGKHHFTADFWPHTCLRPEISM